MSARPGEESQDRDDRDGVPITLVRKGARTARPNAKSVQRARWQSGVVGGVGFALKCLAPVVLIIAIIAGLAYVRLSNGPISLSILSAAIGDSLTSDLPGLSAQFDTVELAAGEGGLQLRLSNIKLSEDAGRLVAHAPFATINLSSRALLSGIAAPERISLVQPSLFGFTNPDGGISFSFANRQRPESEAISVPEPTLRGTVQAPAPQTRDVADSASVAVSAERGLTFDLAETIQRVVAQRPAKESATRYLTSLGLQSARVIVQHATGYTIAVVRSLDVDLLPSPDGLKLAGRLTMPEGQGGRLMFTASPERGGPSASGAVKVAVDAEGWNPSRLSTLGRPLEGLEGLNLPLSGELTMTIAPGGSVDHANLKVDVGRGDMRAARSATAASVTRRGELGASSDVSAGLSIRRANFDLRLGPISIR
ncbi:MAG: hypothetical protein AAFY64_03160 [Pseudomonadota bacterium]